MTTDYKQIIGKHLGRTSSGELMTPYQAPRKNDPSLLVPIPRKIGREAANISTLDLMYGFDVWHAYEFSFLNSGGQPVTGTLKFVFPANTANMIESKSFKLFLNSFDFERFDSLDELLDVINREVVRVAGEEVKVSFHYASFGNLNAHQNTEDTKEIFQTYHKYSADFMFVDDIKFEEDPTLLRSGEINYDNLTQFFHTANLRSACEITNQKDTGHCFIGMYGDVLFDHVEVARYIYSLRDAQHFHENVTEIIFNEIYERYQPFELFVGNIYNRRGGLDIHPVRFTSIEFASDVWPIEHLQSNIQFSNLTSQV